MNTDWIPFAGAAAGAALVYWMQSPVKKQQSFADDIHERVEVQKVVRQMRLAEKADPQNRLPALRKRKSRNYKPARAEGVVR